MRSLSSKSIWMPMAVLLLLATARAMAGEPPKWTAPAAKPAPSPAPSAKPADSPKPAPSAKPADSPKPAPSAKPADSPKPAASAKPAAGGQSLAVQQQQLADRYRQLEEVLVRMAELSAATDPRRAALLKRAVAQSKDKLIGLQFDQLVKILEKDQLSRALQSQGSLDHDLKGLLELLLSENRAKRLESEKARIAAYLKQLNDLIKEQKGIQGRTEGGQDPKPLAKEQGKLADKTGGLAKEIQNKEGKSPHGDPAKPETEKKPSAKSEGKSPQGQKPGKPGSPDAGKSGQPSKPGERAGPGEKGHDSPQAGKPGSGGKPGAKSPSTPPKPGQQEGKPDSPPPEAENNSAERNPAQPRLEEAQKRMREAEKRLDEAKHKPALQEQEEALRELQQAKAALEEILRQLREEEMQRTLAMLEVRFRKMLAMQREVLDGTVRLDKVPAKDRAREHEMDASRLASKESEITAEADKALLLLREDGTTLAFREALEQARQDMLQISQRLNDFKVNEVTQAVERDVIVALEEMLDSLKKAQKKLEERRQKPRSGGGNQEPALVDMLSELRMIRALQMRVNSRTKRYTALVEGEQAEKAELIEAIRSLAARQQRVFEVTRDLELGRNR